MDLKRGPGPSQFSAPKRSLLCCNLSLECKTCPLFAPLPTSKAQTNYLKDEHLDRLLYLHREPPGRLNTPTSTHMFVNDYILHKDFHMRKFPLRRPRSSRGTGVAPCSWVSPGIMWRSRLGIIPPLPLSENGTWNKGVGRDLGGLQPPP